MLIVGERINCSRPEVAEALARRDAAAIHAIAQRQAAAGARYIDVNAGVVGHAPDVLAWLVTCVQEAVAVPLALDVVDPDAIERVLPLCRQTPMVNSVNVVEERLARLLPLLAEHHPPTVAQCISPDGVARSADEKYRVAALLIDRLTHAGLGLADIYVDPCVLPLQVDARAASETLESIERIMRAFPGVHTIIGLSNISFGLPERRRLNEVYLMMAMVRGLDAAILDPLDEHLMASIAVAESLLGSGTQDMRPLRTR